MMAGKPNAEFSKIVTTMPTHEGETVKADPAINPNSLLPAQRTYYRYPGSLTTLLRNRRVAAAYHPHTGRRHGHRRFRQTLCDERVENRRAVLRSG